MNGPERAGSFAYRDPDAAAPSLGHATRYLRSAWHRRSTPSRSASKGSSRVDDVAGCRAKLSLAGASGWCFQNMLSASRGATAPSPLSPLPRGERGTKLHVARGAHCWASQPWHPPRPMRLNKDQRRGRDPGGQEQSCSARRLIWRLGCVTSGSVAAFGRQVQPRRLVDRTAGRRVRRSVKGLACESRLARAERSSFFARPRCRPGACGCAPTVRRRWPGR